jgi:hypothetical protein
MELIDCLINSDDYKDGNTYRGFRLRCKWNDGSDCEYGFAVRTDAGVSFGD